MLAVATATAIVAALDELAPPAALGVVYIVAVLAIATVWGGWLGIATALGSAAAHSWFHIPPTGGLAVADAGNLLALAVLLTVALVAATLSERGRARARDAEQRRREADLAAELARLLVRGGDLRDALRTVSRRLAQALDLRTATIELTAAADRTSGVGGHVADGRSTGSVPDRPGGTRFALRDGGRAVAMLQLDAPLPAAAEQRLRERLIPALEALVAAALEREALQAEVVETAALRRSDVLKTALLRAVSHDLRSPLTAILTAAEALRAARLAPAEHDQLAGDIATEAQRLSRLIDKLLDLSRLEADVAPPRTDWCSLEEIIESAVDVAGDGSAFRLSLGPDLPQVRADPAQLERAFANLLENAGRHSGGHPVGVRARAVGDRLVVRIVDRGPGIAPEQAERIFEPFYRAEAAGAANHRGAGLGLAIARGFVAANGGRIWVESLPGHGSSFVVELPLERVAA